MSTLKRAVRLVANCIHRSDHTGATGAIVVHVLLLVDNIFLIVVVHLKGTASFKGFAGGSHFV